MVYLPHRSFILADTCHSNANHLDVNHLDVNHLDKRALGRLFETIMFGIWYYSIVMHLRSIDVLTKVCTTERDLWNEIFFPGLLGDR